MSERVSLGAAGKLGISGGDIRRTGYTRVTPGRPGMIVVRALDVARYSGGYVHRIAAAGERAGVCRAAALARAVVLDVAGEPGS